MKRNEKIAYLCGEYPRATDTFIQREIGALRKAGMKIETISVRKPQKKEQGTNEQDEERRNTHYLLPCSVLGLIFAHFKNFLSSPSRYLSALRLCLTIRSPGIKALIYQLFYFAEAGLVASLMKKKGIRHLHNHAPDSSGYVAMLAGEMANRTYSMTLHGFGILSEPRRWRLSEKIEKSLFTICVSSHARSQAMLWSKIEYWGKMHIVHCGIDLKNIKLRGHSGVGKNILFVGRFDHVKGLPVLIDAFESLIKDDKDLKLHLVGDGPERLKIDTIIDKKGLNDNVIFYGYRSQEELKKLFRIADVFAMSSFAEGIPVVLMEAMAYGVPVVAPGITGIPELVRDGENGLLCIPGDVATLQKSIYSLLVDPEKRDAYSKAGRKTVEQEFLLDTQVKKLCDIMVSRLEI